MPQRIPASHAAIDSLPTIRVAQENLIDPNNGSCAISLEDNNLGDVVIRLPCGHIFQIHAIIDWLSNYSCQCPVCRYELPTNDPQYEEGRKERMKSRKPRYAMKELKKIALADLLDLSPFPLPEAVLRHDLIQFLVDNDWVDIIPAPPPEPSTRHQEGPQEVRTLYPKISEFLHSWITLFFQISTRTCILLIPSLLVFQYFLTRVEVIRRSKEYYQSD